MANSPVTVEPRLPDGKVHSVRGKITFVNPIVEATGDVRIVGAFENLSRDGQWVLRPGMEAKMVVHVDSSDDNETKNE